MDLDYLVYMLQYDTVHGKFKGTIENKDGKLIVNGKEVKFYAEKILLLLPGVLLVLIMLLNQQVFSLLSTKQKLT